MTALIRLALGFAYDGSVEEVGLLADEDVMDVIASHINSFVPSPDNQSVIQI